MKTIFLKLSTISFFSTIICASCNKETDVRKDNTALLIEKSWKFEIYGLDENNNGVIEETENNMLPCEADDVYTFYANGGGAFKGGTMPCSLDETPVISFNWRFENNCTELAVFAAPEKINRLDENILEVYYMDVNSQGQPVKYIRRFMH